MRKMHFSVFLLVLVSLLSACGFQIRGTADLAFKNLYIQGAKLAISKPLAKSLTASGVTVVQDSEKADLMLEMISENTEKRILSLSGTGLVREFDLYYRVSFRLKDPQSEVWGPMQMVEQRRDYSYTDAEVLAKQGEETRLYDDMRAEATKELLRRLIVQKPGKLQAPTSTF
ncbi:MAG TPA: LPS assembly lipoprotein LptE [Methylophilaceae bacterium]|nr:LPS assembly lipoprotein LptE [Methylophilaceae bacterium]